MILFYSIFFFINPSKNWIKFSCNPAKNYDDGEKYY